MKLQAIGVLAICVLLVAACGPRERTTVTTVRTTQTTVAPVPAGATAKTAGATAGQTAADTGSAGSARVPRLRRANQQSDFGKILLGGAVAGTIIAGSNGEGGAVAAATGPQCANPFGGAPAAPAQSICSDRAEQLACQCDTDGCALIPTGLLACTPTGAVLP